MGKKLDPIIAEKIVLDAGLQPLEPYTNAKTRWPCECLNCGRLVLVPNTLNKKFDMGCKKCGQNNNGEYSSNRESYVKKIVSNLGGTLISPTLLNTFSPLQIECSRGHAFTIPFYLIQRKRWCPFCGPGKSERITRLIFEQLFGYPFPKRKPRWLINSRGGRMEIDGYCKELRIGFEYNGIQHYEESHFLGMDLKTRQEDDQMKADLCLEHGILLFVITHEMSHEELPKIIVQQADQFGLILPKDFINSEINLNKQQNTMRKGSYSKNRA